MRTFISQQMANSEELRSKLAREDGDLTVTQKVVADRAEQLRKTEEERKMTNAEARWLGDEGEVAKAKCRNAKQENEHLRKELEDLRAGFAAQKKELEEEYQKQVDDMFFLAINVA